MDQDKPIKSSFELCITYTLPTKKSDLRSERAELIKSFTERLNKAREHTQYKPLTPKAVAIKTSHLDLWDLRMFYSQCERARNFSSFFWYALKPQK